MDAWMVGGIGWVDRWRRGGRGVVEGDGYVAEEPSWLVSWMKIKNKRSSTLG